METRLGIKQAILNLNSNLEYAWNKDKYFEIGQIIKKTFLVEDFDSRVYKHIFMLTIFKNLNKKITDKCFIFRILFKFVRDTIYYAALKARKIETNFKYDKRLNRKVTNVCLHLIKVFILLYYDR